MHLKSEYFNDLVAIAAKYYPTNGKIEALLIIADIPVEAVELMGPGIAIWNSVISYADKHDKHSTLIGLILEEYPNDELEKIKEHIIDRSAFITRLSVNNYLKPGILSSTAKTFLMYDKRDAPLYVDDLNMQLRFLEFPPSKIIRYDMHKAIQPGLIRKEELLKNLGDADIVLLFITPHFFNGPEDECLSLLFAAYEMRKWIVPVLLQGCLWNRIKILEDITPLPANGQFVSEWENKDEAYLDIVEGVQHLAGSIKK